MLNCRQFARHVATGVDPLKGLSGQIRFWSHYAVCPFCRRYWKEIRELNALHRSGSTLSRHPAVKLADLQSRLKAEIRRRAA